MIVMETSSLVCSRHHFTTSVPEMHCYLFCFFFLKKSCRCCHPIGNFNTTILAACLPKGVFVFIYLFIAVLTLKQSCRGDLNLTFHFELAI